MIAFHAKVDTPCGPFSLAVDSSGAVIATAFGDIPALRSILSQSITLADGHSQCAPAIAQVRGYFDGDRREFDLPLTPRGTPFQLSAWAAMRAIPFGETRTYGQLAATLGRPGGARAAGRAAATNPLCLIVPCHRVLGADGSLTGFAFGPDIKRRLLAHEGAPSFAALL